MKRLLTVCLAGCLSSAAGAQDPVATDSTTSEQDRNKAIARAFYNDLWFSDRTDRYDQYVAPSYIIHDIGGLDGVTESAIMQKEIADFLHAQGDMTGTIDYQIAEGDLVATRWHWRLQPRTFLFRVLGGREVIPIINVFRFRDGKIVEIWNHRHDVDTALARIPVAMAIVIGGIVALAGWIMTLVLWRKLRAARRATA